MTEENGEVRQLLEMRRAFRECVLALESELKAKYERELKEGKSRLREQFYEDVVSFLDTAPGFAEAPKAEPTMPPEAKSEPEPTKTAEVPTKSGVCPECDAKVDPDAKFCSQCAAPLKDEEMKDEPTKETVASASRKRGTRIR